MTATLAILNTTTATVTDIDAARTAKLPSVAYVTPSKSVERFVRDSIAAQRKVDAALNTAHDVAVTFVRAYHTAGKPEFKGYMAAQQEIKAACALALCFAPDTLLKAYRAALVSVFGGELPASQSPAALKKAAQRKAAQEALKNSPKPEAPKGVPENKPVADHEVIGQFIAKYGTAAVLVELAKILATENATVKDAHTLMDVAKHYAR